MSDYSHIPLHVAVQRLLPCAMVSAGIGVHLLEVPSLMFLPDVGASCVLLLVLRCWGEDVTNLLAGFVCGFFTLESVWVAIVCAVLAVPFAWVIEGVVEGLTAKPTAR